MTRNRDWQDDGIEPRGPKRPTEFLTPTFRLMALNSAIEVSKFPQVAIHAAARAAGVRVHITELADRLIVTVTGKIPTATLPTTKEKEKPKPSLSFSPGAYSGAGKRY